MRVLVPYVKANERLQMVVDCLRIQQVQPELVKVGGGDEYHTMLKQAWEQGEFFVVEHDVMVWQGAIKFLHECDAPWCTLPTICHGRLMNTSFGCVKFGQSLIDENPGFWDDIPTTWFHLDANFSDKLGWPEVRPCTHFPPATHLNEVQWPDNISIRWALERKLVWQSMDKKGTVAKVRFRLNDDPDTERVAVAEVTRDVVTPLGKGN